MALMRSETIYVGNVPMNLEFPLHVLPIGQKEIKEHLCREFVIQAPLWCILLEIVQRPLRLLGKLSKG